MNENSLTLTSRYKGYISYWRGDICTVVIGSAFVFTRHIVPACIDLAENHTEKYPKDHTLALVAGWGLSMAKGYWAPSDTLQLSEIPVVNFIVCKEEAPSDFKVIVDKVSEFP